MKSRLILITRGLFINNQKPVDLLFQPLTRKHKLRGDAFSKSLSIVVPLSQYIQRERERKRENERERQTDRQTDRQRERQQADRHVNQNVILQQRAELQTEGDPRV